MQLVFAAISFLRSSWPVVPTTVPVLEEWQRCWDMGLCLDDCLNRTPVTAVSQQPGGRPWGGKDFLFLLMVWAPIGRDTEPRHEAMT